MAEGTEFRTPIFGMNKEKPPKDQDFCLLLWLVFYYICPKMYNNLKISSYSYFNFVQIFFLVKFAWIN